jgi:hypothetical protein
VLGRHWGVDAWVCTCASFKYITLCVHVCEPVMNGLCFLMTTVETETVYALPAGHMCALYPCTCMSRTTVIVLSQRG